MSSPRAIEGFDQSWAFLVAIDRYRNSVPELRTPVADATKLAGILQRHHGFKADVVANEEATLDKLRKALTDLCTRVGKDDRVLFYFAGHGIALDSDEGPRGFLLPQDAARDSSARYLPMVELNEALSALPCRHMLIILDCCFAGAFRWSSTRDLALSPENLHRERYAWYVQDAAWQAIASSAHDQKALDVAVGEALGERGQTVGHSPFAKALMEGLAGAADRLRPDGTGDGVITATELFLHLEEELAPPLGSGRPRQTPILWPLPKHDKGQFVFLVPGKELDLPPAPPLNPDANPWRGLKPYESTHADLFFGRRKARERLVEQVMKDPLVVVTGASGIGKSSLVQAGLLPHLPASIHSIVVRPGPAPFASLAAALQANSPGAPNADYLRAEPSALADWVTKQNSAGREILLIIDQAEELITMNRDEKVIPQYLALVDNALNANQRLRIVVTVRSEFEPQFAQSALKSRWLSSRYLVPQMTQDELRRVIERPAAVKVMQFESADLVDTLVNEVVQMPGALPLLSFALSEMYASYLRRPANDRTLTREHYDSLEGGVTGSLRVRANQVVDGVDKQHGETARRVLERLVSVDAGAFARRRVRRRELQAADPEENARVVEVLRRLDEARLIVTDQVEEEPYLELAHDALILGWDRLLGWVRRDAVLIAARRRLTLDAEQWSAS
ncbi:caspase family protein [Boseaceae bacterium BT-24-1]|nr:caspase family protein [Boseaceae bacterium BT-24-1]